MSVLDRLNRVFRDVLENDLIKLDSNTTAADIEEWDSLSHVRIILAVEQEFKLRLRAGEISSLENVGAFVSLLERKLGA
jgi:acyl carrier protein